MSQKSMQKRILCQCHFHGRIFVVTHIKEVSHRALPVVHDCGEVSVGNVLLFAELPKKQINDTSWNVRKILLIPDYRCYGWVMAMIHSRE